MYGIALILTQIPKAAGLFPADGYSCASLAGLRGRGWLPNCGWPVKRGIPLPSPEWNHQVSKKVLAGMRGCSILAFLQGWALRIYPPWVFD